MKRIWIVLLAVLVLAGAALAVADNDDRRGPGWGGGPGWGMGPGMMGGGWGGPGMMGGWWDDWSGYAQLPADKRAKLRDLAVESQRKMIGLMAGMHELMWTMRTAMDQFPVDKAAATKAWDGMNALRKQMFEAQLDATAKAQDIVGKELWESQGPGPGPGRGPRGR